MWMTLVSLWKHLEKAWSNYHNYFDLFSIASGLQINHVKSVAFWIEGRKESRPTWTKEFRWTFEAIFKLFGMPFGLSLGSVNVDSFLLKKVQHELNYWASTKLSLVGRKMIVNNIFFSSLWYFVSVWGGTKKGIFRINYLLNNYLWARSNHNYRCQVVGPMLWEKKRWGF